MGLSYAIQGVAESEAHCINADANHTWSKFSKFFFLADIFHFDANERIYFFLSRISYFYINSKNEDDLTSASYFHMLHPSITKPPLLQRSRLTSGGSPNLVGLVERKCPVERFMGAANSFHWSHPLLYTCAVQTADLNWFWLLLLRLYSVQGFPLYKDTDLRRATAHQLYCFAIDVGFGANAWHRKLHCQCMGRASLGGATNK